MDLFQQNFWTDLMVSGVLLVVLAGFFRALLEVARGK